MKFIYDKKINALYIELAQGTYEKSRKISDRVMVDEDKKGKVLGIELLDGKSYFETIKKSGQKIDLTLI